MSIQTPAKVSNVNLLANKNDAKILRDLIGDLQRDIQFMAARLDAAGVAGINGYATGLKVKQT